jgi:hypothetical protein
MGVLWWGPIIPFWGKGRAELSKRCAAWLGAIFLSDIRCPLLTSDEQAVAGMPPETEQPGKRAATFVMHVDPDWRTKKKGRRKDKCSTRSNF